MRATVMYGAGDVRVQDVPDPALREPADAVVSGVSWLLPSMVPVTR
jgi:hypothetical protein